MRYMLFFMLSLWLLTACQKEDQDDDDYIELEGVWYLKNVTCECPPANFQGIHSWDFDTDDFELTVTNTPDEDMQILATGVYPYFISATKIIIDSVTYDYFFQNDKLILTHMPELDGPYMEFER